MSKKKKYDFIFSIGEACACTQGLRKSDLQLGSFPFDWMYGGNFSVRIDVFLNHFTQFINKEDLVFLNKTNNEPQNLCDVYQNKKNGLTFNHDFKTNVDFDKMYDEVAAKYSRRIKRLFENIDKAQSLLLVYQEATITETKLSDDSILLEALDKIKSKYPQKKINILYIASDLSMKPGTYKEYEISENITKVVGNYKEIKANAPAHAVLVKFFKKYYKNYSLNMPLLKRLKIILQRLIIRNIPIRKLRYDLREKYHITY